MEYKEALDRAAALCSRQEYSVYDIGRKLESWGLAPGEAEKAAAWLVKEKFIDEERYAGYFVKDKFRLNRWGRVKIRFAMRQKQLPADLIEKALSTIDEEEYRTACLNLLEQKARTLKGEHPLKKKAKLLAFASQRGYESSLLYELLDSKTLPL